MTKRVTETEEYAERVKALRPSVGVHEAKRQVRRNMLREELEAIQNEPTDPAVWRLAAVIEELISD